jgi:anti-sigma factor RsiW
VSPAARALWVDCSLFEDLLERYLIGVLPHDGRRALERHYFGCDRCFEAMRTARALQVALQQDRSTIRSEGEAGGEAGILARAARRLRRR